MSGSATKSTYNYNSISSPIKHKSVMNESSPTTAATKKTRARSSAKKRNTPLEGQLIGQFDEHTMFSTPYGGSRNSKNLSPKKISS